MAKSTQRPLPGQSGISAADRAILKRYEPIVDAVAIVCGPHCEVVLHSLHDASHSVVKIVNSHVTRRSVGAPLTDFGIEILEQTKSIGADAIGPYFTTSFGKILRSMTMIIRNPRKKPIGFLCVNMDLSAPLIDVIRGILPERVPPVSETVERFPSSLQDLIDLELSSVEEAAEGADRNKRLVQHLYEKGIFNLKGSVDVAAEKLGVSMHTIYYHLRDFRAKR